MDYSKVEMNEVFKDDDGHLYKFVSNPDESSRHVRPIVKLKVTTQVKNPNAVKFPSMREMTKITHQKSLEQLEETTHGQIVSAWQQNLENIVNANLNRSRFQKWIDRLRLKFQLLRHVLYVIFFK